MGWAAFLFTYVLGGVTFVPLALCVFLAHAYLTLPRRDGQEDLLLRDERRRERPGAPDDIVQPGDDTEALDILQKAHRDDPKPRAPDEPDVAAGYFAVCREYTPMGINAKPIERTTPVGLTTVAPSSPSVYQTMYRSIFERKQSASPLENASASQRPKKAGNVFYVVLRHGHLMLFDDDEQVEVRHVISLSHHNVSLYSGGDVTPEGELFIKRNAICLSRRGDGPEITPDVSLSKPFYLFADNCSAKEDFYFSLLRNQEQAFGNDQQVPSPLALNVKNTIALVERLHASPDHTHTRWFNALVGRLFLAVNRTTDLEEFIKDRITKKISRVKRPSFLTNLSIRHIDTGDSAPFFTNMKLKDLNVEGECVVESDIKYTGSFRIEVAATARIDLGTRFKAREVDLVLAVVLKKIEGHVMFKIKAPPSNRVWFAFSSMPKLDLVIEPIVSARQITYTFILQQIENRIKEVIAESIVLPFWDDVPFFNTERKKWRGGIWEAHDAAPAGSPSATPMPHFASSPDSDGNEKLEDDLDPQEDIRPLGKSYTTPNIEAPSPQTTLYSRRQRNNNSHPPKAISTALDVPSSSQGNGPWPTSPLGGGENVADGDMSAPTPTSPAPLSGPSASAPTLALNGTLEGRPTTSSDSTDIPELTARPLSGLVDEMERPRSSSGIQPSAISEPERRRNTDSSTSSTADLDDPHISGSSRSPSQANSTGSLTRSFFRRETSSTSNSTSSSNADGTSRRTTLAAVTSAAAQARQWGWNAIQRQKESMDRRNGAAEPHNRIDLSQPMGRGRPLPPPGTPLPPPEKGHVTTIPVPKRQLAPPISDKLQGFGSSPTDSKAESKPSPSNHDRRPVPVAPLPRRRVRKFDPKPPTSGEDNILVVAAPSDSEPGTPRTEQPSSPSPLFSHQVSVETADDEEADEQRGLPKTHDTETTNEMVSEALHDVQPNSQDSTITKSAESPAPQLGDEYGDWVDDGTAFDDEPVKKSEEKDASPATES